MEDCQKSLYHKHYDIYIKPGRRSASLTRHSFDSVDAGNAIEFQMSLAKTPNVRHEKKESKRTSKSTSRILMEPVFKPAVASSFDEKSWEIDYDSEGGVDVDMLSSGDERMKWSGDDEEESALSAKTEIELMSSARRSSDPGRHAGFEWVTSDIQKQVKSAPSLGRRTDSRVLKRCLAAGEVFAVKRRKNNQAIRQETVYTRGEIILSSD